LGCGWGRLSSSLPRLDSEGVIGVELIPGLIEGRVAMSGPSKLEVAIEILAESATLQLVHSTPAWSIERNVESLRYRSAPGRTRTCDRRIRSPLL
jgi:hypothetical protein